MAGPNDPSSPGLAQREPVGVILAAVGGAITTVVGAGVALINAFHPGAITDAQAGAIAVFVGAVWALLLLVWRLVRRFVTPVKAPTLPVGTSVTLDDGTSGEVVRK